MRPAVTQVLLGCLGLVFAVLVPFAPAKAQVLAQAPQSPPSAFGEPAQRQVPPPAFAAPKGAAAPQTAPVQAAPLKGQGALSGLQAWIIQTQQKLLRPLAAAIKRLKSGNAWGAGLWLAGLSFVYGVVHAAGPGHGKAIIIGTGNAAVTLDLVLVQSARLCQLTVRPMRAAVNASHVVFA